MESFIEVVGKTTIYKNKTTIPSEARKKLDLKDGDKITWLINRDGDLVLRKKLRLTYREHLKIIESGKK